ncbi:MFS transporter [Nocardiopsis aegyptia]|uniref:MFS transporter n=1 Tax=Nocardiopsis aegyptia TaxID=220378 RepID=UPI00366FA3E1
MTTRPSAITVFLLCWLALLFDGYDLYVYGATLPGFLGDPSWGATPALAGTVGSLALVGMLIGSLAAGVLTDRWGRRGLMLTSLAVFSIGMLGCVFAPNFAVFAVLRFLTCVGVGGLLPTAVAVANEFAPRSRKSIFLGLVLTGPAVGSLLAALTSALLLERVGVRPVYAVGALSVLLAIAMFRSLPESPAFLRSQGRTDDARAIEDRYGIADARSPQDTGTAATAGTAAARGPIATILGPRMLPATLLMWLAALIALLVVFGLSTWLPVIMVNAGFATTSSVAFLAIYSAGAIVGTIIAAAVSQRTSPKSMVVVGFAAAALALMAAATVQHPAVLVVTVFIAGFGGLGTMNMLNDHIAHFYPARARATGLGWALAVGRLGAIAGPTYGFLVVDDAAGTSGALAFAVPAAIGAVVAVLMPRRAPGRSATGTTSADRSDHTPTEAP